VTLVTPLPISSPNYALTPFWAAYQPFHNDTNLSEATMKK